MTAIEKSALLTARAAQVSAGTRSRVLLSQGRLGAIYNNASSGWFNAASVTLPANTIIGGETIEISGLIEKYTPVNAGTSIRVTIGGVVVLQSALDASVCSFPLKQLLTISNDRKSAFLTSINAFNHAAGQLIDTTSVASLNTTLQRPDNVLSSSVTAIGARAPSGTVMFVSYSAPPTVETVLVDFTAPVTINFDVSPKNGDTVELFAPCVKISAPAATPMNFANPKAISIYGDSLVDGNNSFAVGNIPQDFSSQLRRLLVGYPVNPLGLGGQTTAQIIARLLADPVAGKLWNCIVWAGTNDINTDGPTWWNAVYPYLDQVLAFRTGPAPIFCNLHPRAGWSTGSAYYIAEQYVNAQMLARYGSGAVCDLFSALATVSGSLPVRYYATASTTGTVSNGSNSMVVASASGIVTGQQVYSPGSTAIDNGNAANSAITVTGVSGTTITLSGNASSALSAANVTFVTAGEVHLSNAGHGAVATALQSKIGALGW